MALTYKWSDLLTYVSQSNPRLQNDQLGILSCDMVNSFVWGRYDWRVALSAMAPFYLVPLVQDYVSPMIAMPTDFLGLRAGTLTYNGTEPPYTFPPLQVDRYLRPTYSQSRPESISYEATTGGLRLYPRPPSGIGPMDYQVECTYKKNPTKIVGSGLEGALPFDDQYFQVFVEGLKYFSKPVSQQSPQDFQNFQAMLTDMASKEAVNLGDQSLSPREPLVGW